MIRKKKKITSFRGFFLHSLLSLFPLPYEIAFVFLSIHSLPKPLFNRTCQGKLSIYSAKSRSCRVSKFDGLDSETSYVMNIVCVIVLRWVCTLHRIWLVKFICADSPVGLLTTETTFCSELLSLFFFTLRFGFLWSSRYDFNHYFL